MDLTKTDEIIDQYEIAPHSLIPVLQDIQEQWHYLPREGLEQVARRLELPISQVFRVATFYSAFSLQPRGRHLISVCTGTACHVRGAGRVLDGLQDMLGIEPGHTTSDNKFSLETVRCMGCCALAPVIRVNEEVFGAMTRAKVEKILRQFE